MDVDDVPIGNVNINHIMDTCRYKVEFEDGTIEFLPANILAENILSQVDEDGHKQLLFEEIIDHRSNSDTFKCEDGHVTNPINCYKYKKRTTKGCDLFVQWKGDHSSWVALKDMKHRFLVQVARYGIKHGIDKEPAFHWWVPHVTRKAKQIISKLKRKYLQRTHKYGIRIPKTVEEAYAIDHENNNAYWTEAICEEME